MPLRGSAFIHICDPSVGWAFFLSFSFFVFFHFSTVDFSTAHPFPSSYLCLLACRLGSLDAHVQRHNLLLRWGSESESIYPIFKRKWLKQKKLLLSVLFPEWFVWATRRSSYRRLRDATMCPSGTRWGCCLRPTVMTCGHQYVIGCQGAQQATPPPRPSALPLGTPGTTASGS